MDDPEQQEDMRRDMLELIQASTDPKHKPLLRMLAYALTDKLSQKDLSFAERRAYRELLEAATAVLREDEEREDEEKPDIPPRAIAQ
ncbi:MAG TPA: hypothetical protein VH593_05770 [Ktedonobacteraceae bacterium]